jgi:hypothetical protein
MKCLLAVIKSFTPKEIYKPLGRWRIENCINQMNYKVDLSNEEHCCPCAYYALEKIKDKKEKKETK